MPTPSNDIIFSLFILFYLLLPSNDIIFVLFIYFYLLLFYIIMPTPSNDIIFIILYLFLLLYYANTIQRHLFFIQRHYFYFTIIILYYYSNNIPRQYYYYYYYFGLLRAYGRVLLRRFCLTEWSLGKICFQRILFLTAPGHRVPLPRIFVLYFFLVIFFLPANWPRNFDCAGCAWGLVGSLGFARKEGWDLFPGPEISLSSPALAPRRKKKKISKVNALQYLVCPSMQRP